MQRARRLTVKNPFPQGCRAELGITDELGPELALRFMQLIGALCWAVELGHVDIFLEVSALSQRQANPRLGHLEAACYIFACLKKHPDMGRVAYDAKAPDVDESAFNSSADWADFYGLVEEQLLPSASEPRGKSATISAFVDANHAGNVVTRRLHSGALIFVQNAPVIWLSKRQNAVEGATFGSELVAQRACKGVIVALRHKLRLFGVPIDGPANVFCDNRGVVKNLSIPESTLMKKHNAVSYRAAREAVAAAGVMRVGKEGGDTSLADLLTKVVMGERRWILCQFLMW